MRGRFTPCSLFLSRTQKVRHQRHLSLKLWLTQVFIAVSVFQRLFSWCVISYFFLSGEMLFLVWPSPLSFLSLSQCCTHTGISASFVEPPANPFIMFAGGVGSRWRQSVFFPVHKPALVVNQCGRWLAIVARVALMTSCLHERTSCNVRVSPPTRQKTEDQCHGDDSLLRLRAEFVREWKKRQRELCAVHHDPRSCRKNRTQSSVL